MDQILMLWCLGLSVLGFFLMGYDKLQAKRGRRRVPEKSLFSVALLGGAAGAVLGMYLFHHKTRHWYFRFGFPLLLLVQLLLLGWLALRQG